MKLTLNHYRIITISVNIVLMIFGFVLMVFGLNWMQEVGESRLLAESIIANGSLTFFLGIILIVASAFGLSTIIRKHIALVGVHGVVLLFGSITHFSIAVFSFVELSSVDERYSSTYTKRIDEAHYDAYVRNKTLERKMLDSLQQILNCCGAESYDEYYMDYKRHGIPASCCRNYMDPCVNPFEKGCTKAVMNRTKEILCIAGVLSIIAALIAGVGSFFVFVKTRKMWYRQDDEDDFDDGTL